MISVSVSKTFELESKTAGDLMISLGFLLMSKAGIGDTVSGVFSVSSQAALGALKKNESNYDFCQILFS